MSLVCGTETIALMLILKLPYHMLFCCFAECEIGRVQQAGK